MSNRIIDWLPEKTPELLVFYKYYWLFPEGELLMLSWKDCTVDDARLDEVADRLTSSPGDGKEAYFERVMTTRSIMDELEKPPLNLPKKELPARMTGWMLGQNGRDAALVAMISEAGAKDRAAAIDYVFSSIEDIVRQPRSEIIVAGPTIDSVAIDKISREAQDSLLPFFLLLCLALLFYCLRNFYASLALFFVALMNEELAGTLLYWTGAHVDSISMLISSLVLVLTISGGIHLTNYYRETLQESGDERSAPLQAVRKGILPCSLAVITTVLGMGSLASSKMVPIQTFGIFASITLLVGTCWFFIFLTSFYQQFPIRSWKRGDSPAAAPDPKTNHRWDKTGEWVYRLRWGILLISLLVMGVLAFGVTRIRTTVSFHNMFPTSAKVIRDYKDLETRFGGLVPVEVVVGIPETGNEKVSMLDQLYFLRTICESLESVDGVDAVISALNFTPNLPSRTERTVAASARRSAMRGLLERHAGHLKESRLFEKTALLPDDTHLTEYDYWLKTGIKAEKTPAFYWRVSLRTSSQTPVDYADLLADIQKRVESVRDSNDTSNLSGVQFSVTGGVPLVHKAQEQLLADLINSFLTAFGLIAITMCLMLRGILRGLLAMIPNIFPCVIIFGALGLMNFPIDMGSMMTASVAMGIAVDGTLHFLTWFDFGLRGGMERKKAVVFAYRSCATALLQTTIICGLGMLVFGLSDFIPVSRFAIMMCVLLVFSLIGDVIVLPAILYSPMGRIFEPSKKKTDSPEEPVETPFPALPDDSVKNGDPVEPEHEQTDPAQHLPEVGLNGRSEH